MLVQIELFAHIQLKLRSVTIQMNDHKTSKPSNAMITSIDAYCMDSPQVEQTPVRYLENNTPSSGISPKVLFDQSPEIYDYTAICTKNMQESIQAEMKKILNFKSSQIKESVSSIFNEIETNPEHPMINNVELIESRNTSLIDMEELLKTYNENEQFFNAELYEDSKALFLLESGLQKDSEKLSPENQSPLQKYHKHLNGLSTNICNTKGQASNINSLKADTEHIGVIKVEQHHSIVINSFSIDENDKDGDKGEQSIQLSEKMQGDECNQSLKQFFNSSKILDESLVKEVRSTPMNNRPELNSSAIDKLDLDASPSYEYACKQLVLLGQNISQIQLIANKKYIETVSSQSQQNRSSAINNQSQSSNTSEELFLIELKQNLINVLNSANENRLAFLKCRHSPNSNTSPKQTYSKSPENRKLHLNSQTLKEIKDQTFRVIHSQNLREVKNQKGINNTALGSAKLLMKNKINLNHTKNEQITPSSPNFMR